MGSKYIDTTAVMQVIGCVYNNLTILDDSDKYIITEMDFAEDFHRIVFGAMYKIYELGAKTVSLENILDFLSNRPKSEAIFKQQKGEEWLLKISDLSNPLTFDYYYNRLKKMSLLRAYDDHGIDVKNIYDPDNILDVKKKQIQEDFLDNSTLEDIANKVDAIIDNIRMSYVDDVYGDSVQAGEGLEDLINKFKETPEVGVPLFGPFINTITRGARLKKFYLRSAPTGVGKTRTLIADACYIGCNKIYDENYGWISSGAAQPTLYITTEQEKEEVQTMMLAFLSNVPEDNILNGRYQGDEEQRVLQAAKVLQESPLFIEELPDFSLKDIEDKIKKNIRDKGVSYVFNPIEG